MGSFPPVPLKSIPRRVTGCTPPRGITLTMVLLQIFLLPAAFDTAYFLGALKSACAGHQRHDPNAAGNHDPGERSSSLEEAVMDAVLGPDGKFLAAEFPCHADTPQQLGYVIRHWPVPRLKLDAGHRILKLGPASPSFMVDVANCLPQLYALYLLVMMTWALVHRRTDAARSGSSTQLGRRPAPACSLSPRKLPRNSPRGSMLPRTRRPAPRLQASKQPT